MNSNFKSYDEAIKWLFSQLPMYQREGKAAYKANLDNTIELDNYFNHPHKQFQTIHVAGTNGKGSVSHILASILQTAGYKVGLYTSPHLIDFRERIKINGEMIGKESVLSFLNEHDSILKDLKPSFFEMTVALAFHYFAENNVDIAVVETGMGGRLDSTNIVEPILSVITNIGLDHTAFLGDTLSKIAVEKGGIIKHGIPVVVGETHLDTKLVFKELAEKKGSEIVFADQIYQIPYALYDKNYNMIFSLYKNNEIFLESVQLDLAGQYQKMNVQTVFAAIDLLPEALKIDLHAVLVGLANTVKNTGLLGRWQILSANPRVIADTGHNTDGIKYLVKQIRQTPYKTLHIVFGVVSDKNIDEMLSLMPQNAKYYFTKASIPRALDEKELERKALSFQLKGKSYSTVQEAFDRAKKQAQKEDFIFVGGSTYIVADLLAYLKKEE